MSKKRKNYIPNQRTNPIVLRKQIDKLGDKIDHQKTLLDALSKSHDNYIEYLGNFARHDIKNAILNMDSILTVTEPEEFDKNKIQSLTMHLKIIRETIENFSQLVPYSTNKKFTLPTLMTAVELMSRENINEHKIDFKLDYDRKCKQELGFPFHSLVQMFLNFLINSIKALESAEKKIISVHAKIEENNLRIQILDNGEQIPEKNIERIFDFGFSTTGGSGIGLFHAKYLCEDLLKGSIAMSPRNSSKTTKCFTISLPL